MTSRGSLSEGAEDGGEERVKPMVALAVSRAMSVIAPGRNGPTPKELAP